MKSHRCYDLVPTSSKLVVFDTSLQVSYYRTLISLWCRDPLSSGVCALYVNVLFLLFRSRRHFLHLFQMV